MYILMQVHLNTNAVPLFRYAEVLLNYAEAKAEMGTLTDGDWARTVGVLRARAWYYRWVKRLNQSSLIRI